MHLKQQKMKDKFLVNYKILLPLKQQKMKDKFLINITAIYDSLVD